MDGIPTPERAPIICIIGHIIMPEEVSVQTDREHDFWLAEKLLELEPPADDELRLLREHIDPSGIIIRGEKMRAER